jgi:hypothetical protein
MTSRDGFTRGNEKKTCNARINHYSSRMSDTNQAKPNFAEVTAKFFGITIEQAQAMIDKADSRNRATHDKGMALKESVAQGKFAKGGIWA